MISKDDIWGKKVEACMNLTISLSDSLDFRLVFQASLKLFFTILDNTMGPCSGISIQRKILEIRIGMHQYRQVVRAKSDLSKASIED